MLLGVRDCVRTNMLRLEESKSFRRLVKDMDSQLKAAAVLYPRSFTLFPLNGQILSLFIVCGFLALLGYLMYYLIENFWTHDSRTCIDNYRNEV